MDHMDETLRKAPLFSGMDEEAFQALKPQLSEYSVPRNEDVFRAGDPGDKLYVILVGKVKVGHTIPDGRGSLFAILGPGDLFGEMALFKPTMPRTATATAISQTRLVGLDQEKLNYILSANPEIAMRLLGALGERLQQANETISDLVYSDVPGRVAKALLRLAHQFGEERFGEIYVNHDLTQEEIAQLVGASRETVNKALADFAGRGWIRLEPRGVVIIDKDRLVHRSQ